MKTQYFTLLLISLLIGLNLYAQKEYIQKPSIDKFVGTWEWTSGDEKFQIVITKQKLLYNLMDENYYVDVPVAWHSYSKNGKIIDSSMDKLNKQVTTIREALENTAGLTGTMRVQLDYIVFTFEDKGKKNKTGKVDFKLVPGKTNEATWHLYYGKPGDIIIVTDKRPNTIPDGFTLPINMTLKKVK